MSEKHEEFLELIQVVRRGMFEHVKEVLDKYGLPPSSMAVMYHIRKEPGITASEISRQTGMVKSHVSKTIEGLVEQGFLEKRPDPSDQRLHRLYITAKAGEHFRHLQADIHSQISEVISTLPDEKIEAITDGLRTLKVLLEKKGRGREDV